MQKKCRYSKGEVNCIDCGTCKPKTNTDDKEKTIKGEQLKFEFQF